MFPADAPKGPEPHWLRQREQGFEGSLGTGRTFTLRMVSARCRYLACHGRYVGTLQKIPPVTALLSKGLTAAQRDEARRTVLTPGEPPFEIITCRQLKAVRPHRPRGLARHRRRLFPRWIPPQLYQLVETAPSGPQWLHEIKLNGFRMAARIERGQVQLLTRTGLDWSDKYPSVVEVLAKSGGENRVSRRRIVRHW